MTSRTVKNKMVPLSNHLLPTVMLSSKMHLFYSVNYYIICTESSDLPKHLRCILSLSFSQVILIETSFFFREYIKIEENVFSYFL